MPRRLTKGIVYFMEMNVHGAWVVYGALGVKQYYGYTKEEARRKYIDSSNIYVNE